MGITDDLREYAGSFYLFRYKDVREKLDAIADRIDAEYQKAIRELNNLADASMILPVDADGEPIHVGDELEVGNGKREKVKFMTLCTGGSWLINERGWVTIRSHHVKPDTWERIIEDAMAYAELPTDMDVQLLVARCKALAGN